MLFPDAAPGKTPAVRSGVPKTALLVRDATKLRGGESAAANTKVLAP
jgi:hypothetical protein